MKSTCKDEIPFCAHDFHESAQKFRSPQRSVESACMTRDSEPSVDGVLHEVARIVSLHGTHRLNEQFHALMTNNSTSSETFSDFCSCSSRSDIGLLNYMTRLHGKLVAKDAELDRLRDELDSYKDILASTELRLSDFRSISKTSRPVSCKSRKHRHD